LINWKLYVILDRPLARGKDLKELAREIIAGGADAIQLRDKTSCDAGLLKDAKTIRKLTKDSGVSFIINDRVEIAKNADADGVHLGQLDTTVDVARTVLGKSKIIGKSCHSLEQAKKAEAEGVDYIGIGPIFKTTTKPGLEPIGLEVINNVKKSVFIPFVSIGGINKTNVGSILGRGASCIAVASAIICSDKPREVSRQLKNILDGEHDAVRVCTE